MSVDERAVECREGQITYFNGHLPVFTHAREDLAAFRLLTSQLVVNGSASQGDIRRAFGVPKIGVQRAVDRYRVGGAAACFVPPKPRTARDFLDRFHDEALALARPPRAQQKSFILPGRPPVQALQQVQAGLGQNIANGYTQAGATLTLATID